MFVEPRFIPTLLLKGGQFVKKLGALTLSVLSERSPVLTGERLDKRCPTIETKSNGCRKVT